MRTTDKTIDVIVPVFNEEGNLPNLYDDVRALFEKELAHLDWRVIFVDDGSRDSSWRVVADMATRYTNVRAIRLNRNYGAHIAISAGLWCADGDAAVVLAADLQDPPALIPALVREWESGSKVVWGVRAGRPNEALHRKVFSHFFHVLVRRYALPTYPSEGTGSFCLVDRVIVQNVRRMRENFRTIFGLIAIQGYPAAEVPYVRAARLYGHSGWNLRKMLRASVDVFTSYSHLPVRIITWVGFASCLLAVVGIVYQITHYLLTETLRGWTMLFTMICFFGGVQTLALGVLGEYIWRTFHEVKRRPLWFVEEATFDVERTGP